MKKCIVRYIKELIDGFKIVLKTTANFIFNFIKWLLGGVVFIIELLLFPICFVLCMKIFYKIYPPKGYDKS